MDPSIQMMLAALFPRHTKVEYVPMDWTRVAVPLMPGPLEIECMIDPNMPIGVEYVDLHEIADGVWAGMSEATKVVFLKEEVQ